MGNESIRIEEDLLGKRRVPADVYYGIHTLRAVENFDLTGRRMHPELISALARVKKACALTNLQLGFLTASVGDAILRACDEILAGQFHDQIVVDPLQGGAGTSANMNLNEVIANRADEILGGSRGAYQRVHPLAHVNLNQSTNDVFPTAIKVAAIGLLKKLEQAIAGLQGAFQDKEQEFAEVIKMGRTQLQDAVPMTVGAEFSAWAEALARDRWRIFKCEERLRVVNLGATAIGTGLTAPRQYIFQVVENLRQETGVGFARAENLVDATQNADVFVEVSGILKAHAVNLIKISSDLRLLASGPKAGLMEILLPEVQAGSSIMPGKVNPVVCEAAGQAAMLSLAYDTAVSQAALSGQLELNAFLPLVAEALLGSLSLLRAADEMFHHRCIEGIGVNREACRQHVERSWATVTALVPRLGYEKATEIALEVKRSGKTVAEVVLEKGYLDEENLQALLSPYAMTTLGFDG
jgi:aspartate ammonia-lyase